MLLIAAEVGTAHAAENISVPGDYDSIQQALDKAVDGDTITVSPGTYSENLSITKRITLQGIETARTFLKPKQSDIPTITVKAATDFAFTRFTLLEAKSGLELTNSEGTVSNNVFHTGTSGLAVNVTDSSSVHIENNTIYENATGVLRSSANVVIKNNLFVKNKTAVSDSSNTAAQNIYNNGFFDNDANGEIGTDATTEDPLLTAAGIDDFHLQAGSPAIATGFGNVDIGAYGGGNADSIPFPVQDVSITNPSLDADPFQVTVNWTENLDYRIAAGTPGGYQVNYQFVGFDSTYSNTVDTAGVRPFELTGALPPVSAPDAPTITAITPGSGSLVVQWSAVADATGYTLHYGIDATSEQSIPVGDTTSYLLTGLTNDTRYRIAVSALSQAVISVVVYVYDGEGHTSAASTEATVAVTSAHEGSLSTEEFGIPEATAPYPSLPDEGCFIATAAFGYYSAPQVKALRDFRDNYLLTNSIGRAFVHWYYAHSPKAAQYLNDHADLKPIVRALLYPLILGALFLKHTTPEHQLLLLVLFIAGILLVAVRTRNRKRCPDTLA